MVLFLLFPFLSINLPIKIKKKKKRLSVKLSQRVVQISSSKNIDPMKTRSLEVYTVQAYIVKHAYGSTLYNTSNTSNQTTRGG